jgi:hypothetical protein
VRHRDSYYLDNRFTQIYTNSRLPRPTENKVRICHKEELRIFGNSRPVDIRLAAFFRAGISRGLLTLSMLAVCSSKLLLIFKGLHGLYPRRAVAQAVSHRLPTAAAPGVFPWSSHVDRAPPEQVFYEQFGFPPPLINSTVAPQSSSPIEE